MRDKTGFYRMISGYLKKGIMRPVFSSDDLVILNVAESFYIASNYITSQDGYITFLVNSKMIRVMMVDHSYLENLMDTSDRETLAQMMFSMTDKTFLKFSKSQKRGFADTMTHRFVDPALEQWIFETFGKPSASEYTAGSSGLKSSLKGFWSKNSNK